MIGIIRNRFDYFIWENINQKYSMKYMVDYGLIEEEFINDLLKHKIIDIRNEDTIYENYESILNDRKVSPKEVRKLRTFFKYIYDYEIDDISYLGEYREKIIW